MQTAAPGVRLEVSLAVFDRGAITVEHVELSERATGQIDVAISSAAVCGSDLRTVVGHRGTPERLLSPPVPLSAVGDAFRQMREGGCPRILVRPDPPEALP